MSKKARFQFIISRINEILHRLDIEVEIHTLQKVTCYIVAKVSSYITFSNIVTMAVLDGKKSLSNQDLLLCLYNGLRG